MNQNCRSQSMRNCRPQGLSLSWKARNWRQLKWAMNINCWTAMITKHCCEKLTKILLIIDPISHIKYEIKHFHARNGTNFFLQCLLTLMDSPLNKAGRLQVYIHTNKNVLIEVNPRTRIPRTFARFSPLMGRNTTSVSIFTKIRVQFNSYTSSAYEQVMGRKGCCEWLKIRSPIICQQAVRRLVLPIRRKSVFESTILSRLCPKISLWYLWSVASLTGKWRWTTPNKRSPTPSTLCRLLWLVASYAMLLRPCGGFFN